MILDKPLPGFARRCDHVDEGAQRAGTCGARIIQEQSFKGRRPVLQHRPAAPSQERFGESSMVYRRPARRPRRELRVGVVTITPRLPNPARLAIALERPYKNRAVTRMRY